VAYPRTILMIRSHNTISQTEAKPPFRVNRRIDLYRTPAHAAKVRAKVEVKVKIQRQPSEAMIQRHAFEARMQRHAFAARMQRHAFEVRMLRRAFEAKPQIQPAKAVP